MLNNLSSQLTILSKRLKYLPMNRQSLSTIHRIFATATLVCLIITSFRASSAETVTSEQTLPSKPPHILLILADDLGWKDVGYHGSEIATPNIDRIAQSGIELDRFYVQPSCSPTRTALMTGKSPRRLGLSTPIGKNQKQGIALEEKLLPEFLAPLGYKNILLGKWHLGSHTTPYWPQNRGFDYFYGYLSGGIGYWDHNHGGGHDWQRNGKTVREEGYSTTLLADEAVKLVEAHNKEQPLFLYLSMPAPHLPNEAPEAAIKQYQYIEKEERRIHAAMVTQLDTEIGRVLQTYEERGMLKNTIVVFASDNGGLIYGGIPGVIEKLGRYSASIFGRPVPFSSLEFFASNTFDGGSDNTPLKLGKGNVTEGGIRVPAAIWWPKQLSSFKHSGMMSASDVLPTLLDAIASLSSTNLSSSNESNHQKISFDGASQWALLNETAEQGEIVSPDYLVTGFGDSKALLRAPWKLVSIDELELYNVWDDPGETTNLAEQHPELVKELSTVMENWPTGKNRGVSIIKNIFDMDSFGGPEDREPWAEAAIKRSE